MEVNETELNEEREEQIGESTKKNGEAMDEKMKEQQMTVELTVVLNYVRLDFFPIWDDIEMFFYVQVQINVSKVLQMKNLHIYRSAFTP